MLAHLIFSLLLVAGAQFQGEEADPVKVTVYYESLCPDTIRFFTSQLEPTYRALQDIMTVELHAYGKANDVHRKQGDGYLFTCQHGSNECYGNKVLGCGQKYITDHETYLDFAFCVMGSDYPPYSGDQCATEVGVSYDNIQSCADSTEGEDLLHEQGVLQSQLDPRVTFIPWIIINDEFSYETLDEALYDLRSVVCSAYEGELPSECAN